MEDRHGRRAVVRREREREREREGERLRKQETLEPAIVSKVPDMSSFELVTRVNVIHPRYDLSQRHTGAQVKERDEQSENALTFTLID